MGLPHDFDPTVIAGHGHSLMKMGEVEGTSCIEIFASPLGGCDYGSAMQIIRCAKVLPFGCHNFVY